MTQEATKDPVSTPSSPSGIHLEGLGAPVTLLNASEAVNVGGSVLRTFVPGNRNVQSGGVPVLEMRIYMPGFGIAVRDRHNKTIVVPFTNIESYQVQETAQEVPEPAPVKAKKAS